MFFFVFVGSFSSSVLSSSGPVDDLGKLPGVDIGAGTTSRETSLPLTRETLPLLELGPGLNTSGILSGIRGMRATPKVPGGSFLPPSKQTEELVSHRQDPVSV